jgi:hypothetical protein
MRRFTIINTPPARQGRQRVTLPEFEVKPVDGLDDEMWNTLGWPDNPNIVASSAEMDNGVLIVYYSTIFPKYASTLSGFELKDINLAHSFTKRYEIWLVAHSLLLYQDEQAARESSPDLLIEEEGDFLDDRERQERCRIATLASLVASREVKTSIFA